MRAGTAAAKELLKELDRAAPSSPPSIKATSVRESSQWSTGSTNAALVVDEPKTPFDQPLLHA